LDQIAVEVNKKQEIKQRIVTKKQEIANLEEKIRDLTRDEQVHFASKTLPIRIKFKSVLYTISKRLRNNLTCGSFGSN
jgi:ABC-type Fe3+-citrate transport system substrate-binding protein